MTEETTLCGQVFEVCSCGDCGVVYIVAKVVRDQQRKKGGYSFCPNGHQWGFRADDCEENRIRRERDRLKQEAARRDDEIAQLRREWNDAEKRATAAERKTKRVEKRAQAGLCPCCNRSFSELAKHMATKHPGFRAEDIARENVVSLVKAKAS